jgi:hypothetical protein
MTTASFRQAHRRQATRRPLLPLALWLITVSVASGLAATRPDSRPDLPASNDQAAKVSAPTNLDAFMARVLERRDENWRKLHDYILSETESFGITGPGKLPLNGFKREYTWYVRDGYLIRSPVRFDGVATPEADRRKYEENWLQQEKKREERARSQAKGTADTTAPADKGDAPSLDQFVDQRGEPRFISEAYFLQFKFEPGNYYLAGREQFGGRDVLKIEYYPTGLFGDHGKGGDDKGGKPDQKRKAKTTAKDEADEREIERKLNKVALVTLWVDSAEYQIVKYTFENTEFDFLPGRWLVRLGDVTASMTMSRVLDGVWLPGQITMQADLTFASGTYGFNYGRSFSDYKKAEVGARIRMMAPKQP